MSLVLFVLSVSMGRKLVCERIIVLYVFNVFECRVCFVFLFCFICFKFINFLCIRLSGVLFAIVVVRFCLKFFENCF